MTTRSYARHPGPVEKNPLCGVGTASQPPPGVIEGPDSQERLGKTGFELPYALLHAFLPAYWNANLDGKTRLGFS